MTTDTAAPESENTYAAWEAKQAEHLRRTAEARPVNKAAVFDALAVAGITGVHVEFDGCGDSGQIESVSVYAVDVPMALPAVSIEFVEPAEGSETTNRRSVTLQEAIEQLVYDALEELHPGWEINDGAFGEFVFDVERRTIDVVHNERHMETDSFEHVL
jgi:hypothetical protein